jgi:hypothetical protein
MGIVGFVLDKILKLSHPLNSLGLIFLGVFSLSIFVHILSLKFRERRAVSNMQDLEGKKTISWGSSQWYLSFVWYIKFMICFGSYFFIGYGVYLFEGIDTWQKILLAIVLLLPLTILYGVIFRKDFIRNRDLVKKIQDPA